jgi:hypothetical protein
MQGVPAQGTAVCGLLSAFLHALDLLKVEKVSVDHLAIANEHHFL